MLIDSAILLLEALIKKAEYITKAFNSLNPNATLMKQQYHILNSASMHIWKIVVKCDNKIDHLKKDYLKWIKEEVKALMAQAVSVKVNLIAHRQLKGSATFRKNITLFFDDFKNFLINLPSVKSRNKLTHIRCKWIHCLNPHEIIS